MGITRTIRFETPSRHVYRFRALRSIEHVPNSPGIYSIFLPKLPRERQDTPLLWGIADRSFLDVIERHEGHEAKDPRVAEAIRVQGSFFAVLLVDGHASRRRIFHDLSQVKAVYDSVDEDADAVIYPPATRREQNFSRRKFATT